MSLFAFSMAPFCQEEYESAKNTRFGFFIPLRAQKYGAIQNEDFCTSLLNLRERIVEREFLAADVESIESVDAVGVVFEQAFFGFSELFAGRWCPRR